MPADRYTVTYNALAIVCFAVFGGCQAPGPAQGAPTRTDRLVQAYPELKGGRFAVIADFEEPKHMELFQLIGHSDQAKRTLDPRGGRKETGTFCLRFTSGSPNDAIVVSNDTAGQWYLKQDWRAYDLFMMAVYAPRQDLALELTISGGPAADTRSTHTTLPLHQGWNLTRFDLARLGEQIPLDDVRRIKLSLSGGHGPVDLRIDDLILTRYRMDLLGDSTRRDAGLYVQQIGRRWRVGAKSDEADFEVTFANGQIIEWYNMAVDPYRLRNLVRGVALGPMPTALGRNGPKDNGFAPPGRAVRTRSRIVEMNPVRVVVSSEWQYMSNGESARSRDDRPPLRRWVYTLYPTGQIYVSVETTVRQGSRSPGELGLSVALASAEEGDVRVTIGSGPKEEPSESQAPPAYAVLRHEAGDAALLFVLDDPAGPMAVAAPDGSDDDGMSTRFVTTVYAKGGLREGDVHRWNCHLFVTDNQSFSDEDALARAAAYARPEPPRLEVGSFVTRDTGPRLRNGFDPASGCFVVAPERGLLRFVWEKGRPRPFAPVFTIEDPDQRDVWVYVNHLIFDRTARTADGHLLFQLPGKLDPPARVEVLFRRREP